MHPEALILRRCYPVPVTFANLRAAYLYGPAEHLHPFGYGHPWAALRNGDMDSAIRSWWMQRLKQVTGALDEVYAVVDGREVRVAISDGTTVMWTGGMDSEHERASGPYRDLLDAADRDGYWERPHEVRLDLSPRPVSHGEVARAVLVGQEYMERHGNR